MHRPDFPGSSGPDILKSLKTGKLKDIKIMGETVMVRCLKDLPVDDFNVQIALSITSYARMHMWQMMDYIESHQGVIVYTDTDSLQTDYALLLSPRECPRIWGAGAPSGVCDAGGASH